LTRKRVLIADDNEHNLELARQVLSDGWDVLLALDGGKALEVARRDRPDLALLDLSMPRMNGWDVARALKSEGGTSSIPLVACTAHAMAGDRERALAVGFDGYLSKPYRVRELIACVEDFLGPGVPSADEAGWSLEGDAPP
jgi:two-component system cell cycle response regulator DivK